MRTTWHEYADENRAVEEHEVEDAGGNELRNVQRHGNC